MSLTFGQGEIRLRLKPGYGRKIAEAIFRALSRQAAAGLAPAKRGGVVTLHEVHGGSIWREVDFREEVQIDFNSPVAFLLAQYGGDQLRGQYLEEAEREVARLLEEGLEQVEG